MERNQTVAYTQYHICMKKGIKFKDRKYKTKFLFICPNEILI